MTDRRRNLFVLILVGVLLLGAIVVITSSKTREGLDLKGGVELVYQAKPTKFAKVTGDSIARTLDIMRDRVDQLGVAEPEIQRSGSDQVVVSLPDVKNADRARQQVGTTAQMFFYDWETNVLGENCKPNSSDANTTGGPSAGQPGAATLSYYDAVKRASKCPAATNPDQNTSTDAPVYYAVDDEAKKVLSGPEASEKDARDAAADEVKKGSTISDVVAVQPGTVVVQAEYDADKKPADPNTAQYYVLKDDFALRGTDIKDPEQNFDSGTGGSGNPIVTFNFTDKGRDIWQKTTRKIVQRGQASLLPGADPQSAFQHFAVVLDDKLITVPYIDFQ